MSIKPFEDINIGTKISDRVLDVWLAHLRERERERERVRERERERCD